MIFLLSIQIDFFRGGGGWGGAGVSDFFTMNPTLK